MNTTQKLIIAQRELIKNLLTGYYTPLSQTAQKLKKEIIYLESQIMEEESKSTSKKIETNK